MITNQLKSGTTPSGEKENFFDDTYTRLYDDLLKVELQDQLDFLKNRYFSESSSVKALDLCCGTGRHLIPLVQEGYQVDGVDLSGKYISSIKHQINDLCQANGYIADVQYFQSPTGPYNLIYSIESSIGYLSDEQTENILKNVRDQLKDGGKFVLHLINKEYLIKNLTPRMWFGNDELGYVLENRTLDLRKGTIKLDQTRIIDGVAAKYGTVLRLYSVTEISALLKDAGLAVKNVYGDFAGSDYTINSPYMILEAQKR